MEVYKYIISDFILKRLYFDYDWPHDIQLASPLITFSQLVSALQRKLILKHAHKYRLGLWRPRAEPIKA